MKNTKFSNGVYQEGKSQICLFMVAVFTMATLLMPAPASGQCSKTCGTVTYGMTCMGNAAGMICPTFMSGPGTMTINMTTVLMATNAMCTGTGSNGIGTAVHNAMSGTTPVNCSFRFSAVCQGGMNATVICTIDVADGLPVELMEFSIEDESSN